MKEEPSRFNLFVPVSLKAGVRDSGPVGVRVEIVFGVPDSWRAPAGHRVTDRRRPAPPQTGETLELIRDPRQEAVGTAEEKGNRLRDKLHSTSLRVRADTSRNISHCHHYNMVMEGMQIIPESHLASIGEVVSLHDGVLWGGWRRAGEG